ncbi:hypothetical protein ABEY51_27025 [Priestia megaterium]
MKQLDGFGQEVKLGLLTREVMESYMDKEQYAPYIENTLGTHKYYNTMDKHICTVFTEQDVKDRGWKLPEEE